jgi:F0F1-type ATP synthase membrane subunit a
MFLVDGSHSDTGQLVAALAFTLFPFIVPVNLLIQQAAPVKTQQFLLLCLTAGADNLSL